MTACPVSSKGNVCMGVPITFETRKLMQASTLYATSLWFAERDSSKKSKEYAPGEDMISEIRDIYPMLCFDRANAITDPGSPL